MQSSKILLKDGQTVDLVDSRIDDGDIDTWNNKLNAEITSPNGTINVQSSTDVQTNTKTFDISVNTDIVATNKDVSGLESKINHKLDSKEDVSNKIQVVHDSSTVEYPSSKAVADFVNSSVATNTATFLGNFSLDDLGLTYPATEVQIAAALNNHTWPSGYPTNNDYVYVEIRNPQSSIYDKVQRYKYRGSVASWGYEYTLNNSSFTAEEMAAIDSGITSHDVTNLRSDHTTLGTHVDNTSNPHKVTKSQVGLGNVDNTRDADKPVSTAQQNALNKKLDKTGDASNTTATFTKESGDTSSVTSGSKLSAIFTAISRFFASLKALAFKDKVGDSDINGTISDSHIASASTWNDKQNALSAQTAYSAKGSATKVPQITTNSLGQVTGISEVTISGVTPSSHASTGTTYGAGTTANYGHVKLINGDLNGKTYSDGVAAASAHTHSQYLTSHQAAVRYDTTQSLNDTQKSQARTNIGAGTSNITLGTSSSTAAAGNHNHDATYMKASSGNKSLSFGGTTAIGTVNGSNVNLVMPTALSYTESNSTTTPNFDDYTTPGDYTLNFSSGTNIPPYASPRRTNNSSGILRVSKSSNGRVTTIVQTWIDGQYNVVAIRIKSGSTWGDWNYPYAGTGIHLNSSETYSQQVTGILPVENGGTGQSSLSNVTVGSATKATNDGTGKNIADQFTSARQSFSNIDNLVNDILTDNYFFKGVRYYSPTMTSRNLNPTLNGTKIEDWDGYSSDNKRIYGQLNIIVCNLSSSGYWYDLQVRYIPIDGSKTTTMTWTKYAPPTNDGSNIIFMPLFRCNTQVWIYKNSNKNTGSFDIYRECVLYTGVKEHVYQ